MQNNAGFSFFELIIVLIIVGVSSVFLIPSFKSVHDEAMAGIIKEQILQAIRLARSEAISKDASITLYGSHDGRWGDGFFIKSSEKIIFHQTFKKAGKLFWRAFPKNQKALVFRPNGFLAAENGSFWYCLSEKPVWALMLNQAGHIREVKPDAFGNIKDSRGRFLTC